MHIYGNAHFWKTTTTYIQLASFISTTRHFWQFLWLLLFLGLAKEGQVLRMGRTLVKCRLRLKEEEEEHKENSFCVPQGAFRFLG